MSGNILFLGNKIFEIPPFFQTRPEDLGKKVHACAERFSALKRRLGLKASLAGRSGDAGCGRGKAERGPGEMRRGRRFYPMEMKGEAQNLIKTCMC